MSQSSACRAQFPLVALVAVLAVVMGVGLYAEVVLDAAPQDPDRDLARPSIERVRALLSPGVVLRPTLLTHDVLERVAPAGGSVRVTVRAGREQWAEGPEPPAGADVAVLDVPVRVGPDRVRLGRLRVVVWV
jgi:hypothetical protein